MTELAEWKQAEHQEALLQTYSRAELNALAEWGIEFEGASPSNPTVEFSHQVVVSDGVATNAEIPRGHPLVDDLDPLELKPNCPLYSLFEFPPIRRRFAIGQLGLNRDAPLANRHTRGQHEFQVAMEGLKAAVKLGLPPRDQLLAFVAGATHDPHPALGDAAKNLLGISEVDAADEYWIEKNSSFWEGWLEKISANFGLRISFDDLQKFIQQVIRRQEHSLPGVLAHGPSKSELDLDFFAFTAVDTIGMQQALRVLDSRYDSPEEQASVELPLPFSDRMLRLRDGILEFDQLEDLGRLKWRIPIYLHEIDIRPHLTVHQGHLLISDPATFHRLVQLSAVLYEAHYYHSNNLGPEWMFAREIRDQPRVYPPAQDFLRLTDQGIINRLRGTPAERWTQNEAHHGWKIYPGKNNGQFSPESAVEGEYPPVNLRLSTLVRDQNGRIGPWKDLFTEEAKPLLALESKSGQPITLVWDGNQ